MFLEVISIMFKLFLDNFKQKEPISVAKLSGKRACSPQQVYEITKNCTQKKPAQ